MISKLFLREIDPSLRGEEGESNHNKAGYHNGNQDHIGVISGANKAQWNRVANGETKQKNVVGRGSSSKTLDLFGGKGLRLVRKL